MRILNLIGLLAIMMWTGACVDELPQAKGEKESLYERYDYVDPTLVEGDLSSDQAPEDIAADEDISDTQDDLNESLWAVDICQDSEDQITTRQIDIGQARYEVVCNDSWLLVAESAYQGGGEFAWTSQQRDVNYTPYSLGIPELGIAFSKLAITRRAPDEDLCWIEAELSGAVDYAEAAPIANITFNSCNVAEGNLTINGFGDYNFVYMGKGFGLQAGGWSGDGVLMNGGQGMILVQ